MTASGSSGVPKKLSVVKTAADSIVATPVRYPPAALTSLTTTLSGKSYGNGTYTTAASTAYGGGFNPNLAFDYSDGANGWACAANKYVMGTGIYQGTASTSGYTGEYIEITMPVSVTMKSYTLVPSSNDIRCSPRKWRWYGSSNNGATWTMLDERTGQTTWVANTPATYTIASPQGPFNTFRLVVNEVTNVDLIWLFEIKIFA